MTTIALTIAGSDSGGGAGIQADLKTFSALGVYGASVITALTAQNTLGVQGVYDVPTAFIRQQLDSVLSDLNVKAIKIGMLSRRESIRAVAAGISAVPTIPVVLDPVMVAASGDLLLRPSAIQSLKSVLMPLATVITPNLHEAAALTGQPIAANEGEMERQARMLCDAGARAVLIKGGHGSSPESIDILVTAKSVKSFSSTRVNTPNVHGTGCTLSSAIAAGIAKGYPLVEACDAAKIYITEAIAASEKIKVGRGHGPAHHFHKWW